MPGSCSCRGSSTRKRRPRCAPGTATPPAWITDEQVQRLREAGWTDAQIAEAVYDGALFNLLVRLADAFDIHPDPSFDAAGVPGAVTES